MTFGVDDFLMTRVGGESEYKQGCEDVGRRFSELLRVLIRCDASGENFLFFIVIGGICFIL
jgi:hypothetical protein